MRRSVFQYKDPLHFILDQFRKLQSERSGFSVRDWSREMGLKSPTLLVMILKGQRPLRVKFVEFLAPTLGIDEAEKLYFKTLILRQNARSEDERNVLDQVLRKLSPGDDFSAEYTESESIFEHWSTLTLLTASKIPGFELEPEKARGYFIKDVDLRTIRNGIQLLESEGFLSPGEKGNPVPAYKRVSSKNETKNLGARTYHRQVMEIAKEAVELPFNEREFQSFSLAIDENNLTLAKELIRDLRNRLASLEGPTANRVYHANLHLFPLTKRIESNEV